MKKILLFIVCTGIIVICRGQVSKGISQDMLIQIKSSFKKDANTKAIINAVTNNDIKPLTLNRSRAGQVDHYFSNKVKTKGITNQKQSGRCWLFTGLNVIKPFVLDTLQIDDFEFSENYSFFWDQLEKSNLFLDAIISTKDKLFDDRTVDWLFKNPISDGGQWACFADVVEKYGVVPNTAMPETNSSNNTSAMSSILARKLREDGLKIREMANKQVKIEDIIKKKIEMLSEIYRILVICLGEPPENFLWRYIKNDKTLSELKTYTPKSFYDEVVGANLRDYVMIMNDPTREYNKLYEIQYDGNMTNGTNWKYINLPVEMIKQYAIQSIKNNQAIYFSCDVGKQANSLEGILDVENYDYESLYGVKFGMNKTERIKTFDSGSSHGMALIGVDLDVVEKPVKWMLENSWGADKGHNGYLTMTDKWFDEYMFRIVINKKYIDEKTLQILKQKPVMLPPWDYMFQQEK